MHALRSRSRRACANWNSEGTHKRIYSQSPLYPLCTLRAVEHSSEMPDYEGDEGLDGLDDALGIVVARKTNEQKRVIDQHEEKILTLDEEVERLKKRAEAQIDQELYTRDYTALRRDAAEAAILAREARHDVIMHSATVRDELTQQLREELAKGLTAQNALATSHAQALAGLQTSNVEHHGRLSAAEAALRSATEAQANFSGDLQERIASGLGASGAQIEQAQQDISSAKAQLDRLAGTAAALQAENEQLREELDKLRRLQKSDHDAHEVEIEKLKGQMRNFQLIIHRYLGVDANALESGGDGSAADHGAVDWNGAGNGTSTDGAGNGTGGALSSREAFETSHAFASTDERVHEPAPALLGGPGLDVHSAAGEVGSKTLLSKADGLTAAAGTAGASHGTGSGFVDLPQQLAEMQARLSVVRAEWDVVRSQIQTTHDFLQDERLTNASKQKASEWKDEIRHGRLEKVEMQLSSTAPASTVTQIEQLRALVGGDTEDLPDGFSLDSRVRALETSLAEQHTSMQEELTRLRQDQAAEFRRYTEEQLEMASSESSGLLHPIRLRVESIGDTSEAAHATATAAMRKVSDEVGELRKLTRAGQDSAREALESSLGALQRQIREEMRDLQDDLGRRIALGYEQHTSELREMRQRLGMAWEGVRESRAELGDVMQTLHQLLDTLEVQHVVNQLLSRAAFANGAALGTGPAGFPKSSLTSPRAGLAVSHAASSSPLMLPAAMQHSHRRCLKRGDCTCHERLSATLAAGDPRLALDHLFDRQLTRLTSVRRLWRHAESARGALPHITPMPGSARGTATENIAAYAMELEASHEINPGSEDFDAVPHLPNI